MTSTRGHDLHREGQRRAPARLRPLLVGQEKLGRRLVGHARDGAHVVVHLVQQVGFYPAGEVQEHQARSAG